jgi:methyl-accepting chemotaxis protein
MKKFRDFLRRTLRAIFRPRRSGECRAVLPVIRTQLQETSRQVEEAVTGVCGSFTGIAARAREAVAESTDLLDGQSSGQGATVESSIETSRRTIASLLERMERATKLSDMAVSSMEEVSTTVTGIEELLGQVQRIAFTNKLVALNAKIEAVHVGELGSGFEVVADEISRQAERSTELVNGISSRINEMRGRVDSAAGHLREFLAEGRQRLDQSQNEAEGALTMLWSLHQRTRDSLERHTQENSRLAADIAAAVVGLQFQDRVKQRIEHVIEALEKLEGAMTGTFRGAADAGSDSEVLASVHSSYTMESEREAHYRAIDQVISPAPDAGEMEVELF